MSVATTTVTKTTTIILTPDRSGQKITLRDLEQFLVRCRDTGIPDDFCPEWVSDKGGVRTQGRSLMAHYTHPAPRTDDAS